MSLALQFTLTQAGLAAVFNARKTGLDLALTHIQLGSGQATPQGLETALIAPQQTALIASGSQVTPTQIRMSATFSGDAAYPIGEIGVWAGAPDAAGSVLVAYWSRPAAPVAHKSAGVDFIFTHDMAIADALGAGGGLTVHIDPTHAGTTALVAAHEAAADPHPQYLREDEAQAIAQQAVQQAVQPLAAQQASHTTHPDPHPQYVTHEEGAALMQQHRLSIGEGLTETLADNVRGVALASTQAENIGWKNGLHYDKFGRVTQIAHVNAGLNDGCRRVKIIPDAQYQILRDDFGAALILENKTGKSGNVTSQKYCEFKMPAAAALVAGDSVFIVNNSGLPIYLVAQNGNIIANQTSQKASGFLIDANYNIKALWDGTQLHVMTELRHTPRKPAPSTDYFLTNTKESARWHTEELEFHHLGRIVLFQAQLNTHYASFYIPQNIFNGHLPLLMLYSVVAWGSVHSPDLQNVYMFFKPKNLGDDVKPNDWIFNKAGNRVRYEAIVLGQGSDDTDQGRGLTGMAGKVLWEYQDKQDFCISGNFKAVVTVMATGCYYAKSQKSPIISETVWTGSRDAVVVEEPPPTRTT